MSTSPFLQSLAEGCQAEEFAARIETGIFQTLSDTPTTEAYNAAKLDLQDLFHAYRQINPCQASAFTQLHRCIFDVYCDAYDRLKSITPVPPPAPVRRQRRKSIPPSQSHNDAIADTLSTFHRIFGDDDGTT